MCSNTESTRGSDGDFSFGVGRGDGVGWNPTPITRQSQSHTNKRQRVPKRGPGVAELEKILREQENTENNNNNDQQLLNPGFHTKDASQPLIPITTSTHHHRHLDQVSLLTSPASIYSNGTTNNSGTTTISKTFTTKYVDNNALLESCIIDHNVGVGGSQVVLPESTYFQAPWTNPIKSNSIDEGKSDYGNISWAVIPNDQYSHSSPYLSSQYHPLIRQKKQSASICQMNNQLSGSASSSYGGLCHQIEPPSNQNIFYQNYQIIKPQEKVIGLKRRPPSIHKEENRSVAAGSVCQYQVPSVQSHHRRIPEQATLFNCGMGHNLNFTLPLPRDIAKSDVPVEFNQLKNCTTETTTSATTTSTVLPQFHCVQQQLCKIDEYMLPLQGGIRESNQVTLPSAKSDQNNKRFYSFLPAKDQMAKMEKLVMLNKIEKDNDKAVEDDIDLNLKLSTYS
ncbi:hypothetical protein F8388_019037 [Cannabis sativa]|uniref:Uncharacterized protein n=1 Tax=Cannabis sativa TaxID=3483 RepID=A0A7J6H1T8_CANSA|nr:hypothetical protein F8388_019037 [Cannabis sativa]